jgi:hypothetical protein
MFPILPIVWLIRFLYWLAIDHPKRMAEQRERDRLAQEIAEDTERRILSEILSGKDIAPFALYLRPFALEKDAFVNQLLSREMSKFDHILQSHYEPLGITLLSIGSQINKEGAGHVVTTDDQWRERFRQLAERATTIVVVPGVQPGIMSEIRWLRVSGLLVNSVFFKPTGYPKAEWRKMQEIYEQQEDIELPDYSPKQLSFRMYSSGICYDVMTWSTVYFPHKRRRGRGQMRSVLSNRP